MCIGSNIGHFECHWVQIFNNTWFKVDPEKVFIFEGVFFVGTTRPCVKVFSCEDFMVLGLQVRRMRRMTRDACWLNAGDLIPQACRRCTKCARCVGADMFCTFANIVNMYKCVHLFAH